MLDFDNQDGTSHLKTPRPMHSRPVVMIDLEKTDPNGNSVTDTEGTTQYDGLPYQVGKKGETHNEALKSQRRPGTIEEMLPGGNESSHVLTPTSSEILDAIFDIIPRLQAAEDMTVLQEHSYATTDSSSVGDNSSQVSIRLCSDGLNSTKCESVDMQHSNDIQHSGVVCSNVNSPGCEIQSSLISSNLSSPMDIPVSFQDGDLRSGSKTSSVQGESDRIDSDLAPSIESTEILLTDIPSIVSSLNENVELTSNGTVHSQNVDSYAIQRPQDFSLPLRTTAVGDSHFETVRFQDAESLRLQGSEEVFSNDSNDGSRLRTRKQTSLQITNQPVDLVKHPNFVVTVHSTVHSTVPLNALGSSTNSTSKEKITKKNKVNETAEKREERLRMQRERARLRRSSESKEQRETRRQKDRERQQLKRERDRVKACGNGEHVDMRSEIDLSNNEVLSELTHSITSQTITPTSILSVSEEHKNEPKNKDRSVNETRSTGTQLSLPKIRSNLPEVTIDVPCKDISGYDDAKDALDDSKDALDDAKDALDDAKDALDDSKDALDDAKDALDDSKDALDDTKDALDDTKDALDDTKDVLDDTKDVLDDTKDVLDDTKNVLDDTKNVLDDTKDALDDTKNALKLSQKEKNHTYAKKRRARETPEQRESRLREQRERMRKERVSETDAQRETRRLRDRVRKQVKRSAEEEEIRSKRLTQEREASRRRRSLESAEEKQTRRMKDRDRARKRRASKRVAE